MVPSLARGTLSGIENIARRPASRVATWKASERSTMELPFRQSKRSLAAAVKCGSNRPTLCGVNAGESMRRSAPFVTLGQKDALAQQGAQDPRHHLRADIVVRVRRHHMADAFRIVDKDGGYAEERSASERNVERVIRKDTDAVSLR